MKRKYWGLIVLLLTLTFVFACTSEGGGSVEESKITEKDRAILKQIKEVEWPKAYAEHDTLLLDKILGEDFKMIDQGGNWYTKKDELEWIKKNATKNDSFHYEIKRFDIFPNGTAIICGTGHIVKDTAKSIYQSSNIFVKRNNNWKAVQSHVSGVKKVE